ncbi:MAG: acyltransferase family protein [Planctomycetaceae bacterium]
MPSLEELQVMMQQMQNATPEATPSGGQQAAGEALAEASATERATSTDGPAKPSAATGEAPPRAPEPASPEAMAEAMQNRGLYAVLPPPLTRHVQRGYLSTGLFFMLSGFVLAYLYLDRDGGQTVSNREFWLNRIARLYPLHLTLLVLLIPMAIGMLSFMPSNSLWKIPVSKPVFGVVSGLLSVFLVQAWCPEAALTWNFATWALSAVAFFYLMFPPGVALLQRQARTTLWILFWLMPVLNLIPTLIYLWQGEVSPPGFGFWSELVMRTPLFWLPHFVMAIVLCRLFQITRHDMGWVQPGDRTGWKPGLGDLAALVILLISITPDAVFSRWFGLGEKPPNFILRHGFMCPIYAVFLYELAQNRGIVARLLSHPWCETLGEASFGIFIFQGPLIFPSMMLFGLVTPLLKSLVERFTTDPQTVTASLEVLRVGFTVLLVIGLSLLSVRYFEKPIAKRLKARWGLS